MSKDRDDERHFGPDHLPHERGVLPPVALGAWIVLGAALAFWGAFGLVVAIYGFTGALLLTGALLALPVLFPRSRCDEDVDVR